MDLNADNFSDLLKAAVCMDAIHFRTGKLQIVEFSIILLACHDRKAGMAYMRCSKGKQNGGQHVEGTQ
jgi:hypothetical protein